MRDFGVGLRERAVFDLGVVMGCQFCLFRIVVGWCCACCCALVVGVCGGCATQAKHGASGLTATYFFGALGVEFPARRVDLEQVASASRAAAERRGYTITKDARTGDRFTITAEAPKGGGTLSSVTARNPVDFVGTMTNNATRLEVRVWPLGDEQVSRALLDETMAMLGL